MSTTPNPPTEIWLIRHGETEWSLAGRHTGRTDIPLTANGRHQAEALRPVLAEKPFDRVLCSPLQRARDTCRLAGLERQAEPEPRLLEWDYGAYEGRTTADIRQGVPGWTVWTSPVPQGEDAAAVQRRVGSLLDELQQTPGRIALFAHAHVLRALAGCWIAGDARLGAHLVLDTASFGVLGHERESRAILHWNAMRG